ncbi:MAG: ABC transporter ATP-binding protein [Patescibacteria group bacterium]
MVEQVAHSGSLWLPRFRLIAKYLAPYRSELIGLSGLGVVSAISGGLIPYVVGKFLDGVISMKSLLVFGTELPEWLVFVFIFLAVQILSDFMDWTMNKRSSRLGTLLHGERNAEGVAYLLRLPLSFHKNNKPGEVTEIMWKAAMNLSNFMEQVVIRLTPQFLSILVGLLIVFYLNIALSSIMLLGIVLYCLLLLRMVRPLAEATSEGNTLWSKASGYAHNINSNVFAVKQAGSEVEERKNILHKYIDIAAESWIKVEAIWMNVSYLQNVIVTTTRALIFLFSVYFIARGELTIGGLVAFNGYAAMVFGPFSYLGRNWATVENVLSTVERADKILSLPPEPYTRPDGIDVADNPDIEFGNVFFKYKEDEPGILKGVSFKVAHGEVVALVGRTGAGKSTLIDLLSGYYEPTKGEVLFDGVPTSRLNLKSLRSRIAAVPQEVALFNDTIRANIAYGSFDATDSEIAEAAKKAHVDEFVDKFPLKYEQEVGHRGVKLSVGQKQRVAIARAILRDPSILILDEPTSALDAETEKYITDSLEELMKGRTTFIIAHRLSTVRRADRILYLERGKIVEEGSHNQLMKIAGGKYRKMYELHAGKKSKIKH